MVFTNDTTDYQKIQQTVSELFKNRVEFYRLIEELEVKVGLDLEDKDIAGLIDFDYPDKITASLEDVSGFVSALKA